MPEQAGLKGPLKARGMGQQ